tara:strand:+ start:29 stop:499 length:471 start_codon:yes stop_codon:yes gene_type:complete
LEGVFLIIKELLEKFIGNQKLVFIQETQSTFDAAKSMVDNKCGALLVSHSSNSKTLKGIVTERDLAFRVIPKLLDPKKTLVSQIMTKSVDTVSDKKTIFDAIALMKKNGYRHLPVTSNKQVTGILSMRDLYHVAHNSLKDSLKQHEEFLFGTGYGG